MKVQAGIKVALYKSKTGDAMQLNNELVQRSSFRSTKNITNNQAGRVINISLSIEVATLLSNAQTLMKHSENELALNLLRQACNQDSKNIIVLESLANLLEVTQKFDEEIVVRNEIAKIKHDFVSTYKKASCLYRLNRDAEALPVFYESLSLVDSDHECFFDLYKQLGNILVRMGDYDGAEEFYNKAYIKKQDSDSLMVNIGTLEVQRGDLEKALFCFRKAIEINKNNDKAWVGLAMVHRSFGDFELAWANIKAAVEINPKNKTTNMLIAHWAITEQKVDYAIAVLAEYLNAENYDQDLALVLINCFCLSGMMDAAKIEIERFLLWHPENTEVRNLKRKIEGVQ